MSCGTLGGAIYKSEGERDTSKELQLGPGESNCHALNCFVFQIPALAQAGFRVLAIDMKGYGDSSSPPGELVVL